MATIQLYANNPGVTPQVPLDVEDTSLKDAANGYAGLDASGRVPIARLASGTPDGTKFIRDDGVLAVPAGAGGTSLAKSGSAGLTGAVTLTGGTNVTLTQSGQDISIAAAAGSGFLTKLFDSTLGADAASIDTGAGGIAGTADTLKVFIVGRTTQVIAVSAVLITFNNDGGANYDVMVVRGQNTTPSATNALAASAIGQDFIGASAGAGGASCVSMEIPCYAQTTFHKVGTSIVSVPESTAANNKSELFAFRYRSTAAISRMKVAANSGNLLAGTRLLIYGM